METGYQRGKIQEESLLYEHRKHDGSLPAHRGQHLSAIRDPIEPTHVELARATEQEKESQLARLADFQRATTLEREAALARAHSSRPPTGATSSRP